MTQFKFAAGDRTRGNCRSAGPGRGSTGGPARTHRLHWHDAGHSQSGTRWPWAVTPGVTAARAHY
eukprot:748754-Hanusia_phi.AAC.1